MTPKKFTGNASTLTSKPFPPLCHFIRLPRDKAASLVLSLWMMPGWGTVSLEDSQTFLLSRRSSGSSGAQIHALLHVGSCCRTLLHGAEWLSAAVLAAQYCPHLAKLLTLWGQSHQSLHSGSFLTNSLLWSSFECVNHEVRHFSCFSLLFLIQTWVKLDRPQEVSGLYLVSKQGNFPARPGCSVLCPAQFRASPQMDISPTLWAPVLLLNYTYKIFFPRHLLHCQTFHHRSSQTFHQLLILLCRSLNKR